MSFAQHREIGWKISDVSIKLKEGEPKTLSDSMSYIIKDTSGEPCATVIVVIQDDKLGILKFGGTLGGRWKKITPNKYCLYVMDDGEHEQRIIIQSSTAREIISSDSIPRFISGRQYYLEVWEKSSDNLGPDLYNPKFKVYVGAGFNPMLQLAPTVNIGFDFHCVNVWFSASHSLTTSEEAYVYNSANELLGKHNYHYLRLGINVGYEFEPWKQKMPLFGFMPQVGIAWDHVYSTEKGISGNGFNAYTFVAGARLALKTNNRHWCFFATPEFNLNLGSKPSNNYDNITQSVSGLKKSFDVQVGVLYYF